MVKPQPSKRDGLMNPPSSRLATLSKYEKIRLDASSIQVPQGQMLFWGRGNRMLEFSQTIVILS